MSNIKIQCKKIERTLLTVIKENPLAAVFMIGNLYRSIANEKGENLNLLQTTLSGVKKKLTPTHIQSLWETITNLPRTRLSAMDNLHRSILRTMKHEMVHDIYFIKHLKVDSLVELGQDIEFYREVLIALIRKHLHDNGNQDPFSKLSFSYQLLKEGSSEQNSRYLSKFIKDCASFPLDNIVLLGTEDKEIASFILIDLKDCCDVFEISRRFVYEHPELRKEIAKDLQNYLDTLPLNSKERKFCEEKLPKLKEEFVEFKNINTESRPRRDNQVRPANQDKSFMRIVCEGLAGGAAGSYVLPAYMSMFGLVFTVPAALITIPMGIGFTFAFDHMRVSAKQARERSLTSSSGYYPEPPRPRA